MEFQITNIKKSINDLMRSIGYQPAYFQHEGEISIVRQIGRNDYPRFHVYIRESLSSLRAAPPAGGAAWQSNNRIASALPHNDGNVKSFTFSLHLDQKKPSYEGSTGHSGDYDGDVVENEVERIKSILSQ